MITCLRNIIFESNIVVSPCLDIHEWVGHEPIYLGCLLLQASLMDEPMAPTPVSITGPQNRPYLELQVPPPPSPLIRRRRLCCLTQAALTTAPACVM